MDVLYPQGDVEEPANCHQINGCDLYYPEGKYTYLNLTCIKCDDIPQMSKLSVFWQVSTTRDNPDAL